MSQSAKRFYEFGPYRLDLTERLLLCQGRQVPITPKVFSLLLFLVQHPRQILDKDKLMTALWPEGMVEESNLTRNISSLRKALSAHSGDPQYIETIPWRGYRFVADVREMRDGNGDPIEFDRAEVQDANGDQARAFGDQRDGQVFTPHSLGTRPELEIPVNGLAPAGEASGSRSTARRISRRAKVAGAALIAAIVCIGYLIWSRVGPAESAPVLRMSHLTNTGNSKLATISPDGRYVAYVIDELGEQSLWIKLIAAAGDAQIVPPAEVYYGGLTFSPDSSYLYYITREKKDRNSTLYHVAAIGGTAKKLKTGLDSPVTFSPDGARIAFVREYPDEGKSSLMIAGADGSGEIELASRRLPDYYDYPAWAPDGEVIACTFVDYSGDRQRVNVVEVRVRDGKERPIGSQSWQFAYKPQWLSDGRGLVLSGLAVSATQIFLLSYPGGETSRITNDLNTYLGASLTADSRALVTVEQTLLSSLWITPIGEMSRARQLTFATDRHGEPHWTPDGKLVYSANTQGNWDIWKIEADGTGRKQLTFDAHIDQNPSASPDGRYIVFSSTRGGVSDIWRVDTDGANLKQLTFGGGNVSPRCTPDGEWVVYVSINAAHPFTIHKVPINGGGTIQLTDTPCRSPAVSPDGKLLACYYVEWPMSTQIESRSIAVINLSGESPIKFYDIPVTVDQRGGIRWTPDGQSISYIDNRDGNSNIWSRPLSGGPAKRVTDFRGDRMFAFDWSRDGTQLVCLRGIFKQDVVMISDFRLSGR